MTKLPHSSSYVITKLLIGLSISFALVMVTAGPAVVTEAQPSQQPAPFVIEDVQQQQSSSPESPTQLSQGMIADLAKPAVVQVGSYYTAKVSAYDWIINQQMMQADLQSLVSQGVLDPNDPQAIEYARTALFSETPAAYISPINSVRQAEAEAELIGSGFIVTPDGYIATNAHVVAPPQEEIQNAILENAALNFINSDLEQIGIQFETQEQYDAVVNALIEFYSANIVSIDDPSSMVFVLGRYSVPGVVAQAGEEVIPAELLTYATGEPIPGKDVAIVKIEATNLPALPLGDEGNLQTLDNIIVVGFPGAVSSNPVLSQTGQEPTVLTGQFNGFQRTIGGWNAIGVQAPIGHGNSGGPALDSLGRVIGIATFGSIDPTTGQESAGFNFLVPISIVKDFLNRANIQTTESQFTTMFRQALTAYSNGDYQQSLSILQQLNAISPNNPYVINYLSKVQQGAGSSSSSSATNATNALPANSFPNSP